MSTISTTGICTTNNPMAKSKSTNYRLGRQIQALARPAITAAGTPMIMFTARIAGIRRFRTETTLTTSSLAICIIRTGHTAMIMGL